MKISTFYSEGQRRTIIRMGLEGTEVEEYKLDPAFAQEKIKLAILRCDSDEMRSLVTLFRPVWICDGEKCIGVIASVRPVH